MAGLVLDMGLLSSGFGEGVEVSVEGAGVADHKFWRRSVMRLQKEASERNELPRRKPSSCSGNLFFRMSCNPLQRG